MFFYLKTQTIAQTLYEEAIRIYRDNAKFDPDLKLYLVHYLSAASMNDLALGHISLRLKQDYNKSFVEIDKYYARWKCRAMITLPIFDAWEAQLWGYVFNNYVESSVLLPRMSRDRTQLHMNRIRRRIDYARLNCDERPIYNYELRWLRQIALHRDYGLDRLVTAYIAGTSEKQMRDVFNVVYNAKELQKEILQKGAFNVLSIEE